MRKIYWLGHWEPRVVVYFCGTNDLNRGVSPKEVLRCFVEFRNHLAMAQPWASLIWLGPTITPFVRSMGKCRVASFEHLDRLVRDYADTVRHEGAGDLLCVSTPPAIQTDRSLYLGDQHHLNDAGHAALAKALGPTIVGALQAAPKTRNSVRGC